MTNGDIVALIDQTIKQMPFHSIRKNTALGDTAFEGEITGTDKFDIAEIPTLPTVHTLGGTEKRKKISWDMTEGKEPSLSLSLSLSRFWVRHSVQFARADSLCFSLEISCPKSPLHNGCPLSRIQGELMTWRSANQNIIS